MADGCGDPTVLCRPHAGLVDDSEPHTRGRRLFSTKLALISHRAEASLFDTRPSILLSRTAIFNTPSAALCRCMGNCVIRTYFVHPIQPRKKKILTGIDSCLHIITKIPAISESGIVDVQKVVHGYPVGRAQSCQSISE